MKIETLTVALRPRTAWEAVELGTALVRRHAGAVWRPWLLLTVPVFVLLNVLAWAIGAPWLAALAMWWLKPVFDRVPLYVLSRAVFGDVPDASQTLRAQAAWGRRWLPAYLTWRRLSPVRALYLPVDLLEGAHGGEARQRRRGLGSPVYGVASLLTIVCLHFEIVLSLGLLALVFLFVPDEYLSQAAQRAWALLAESPDWLSLSFNLAAWLATSLIEPFYVGAGLGLYLNRRTEVEAWDIELSLRRLRARLSAGSLAVLIVVLGAMAVPSPASAQQAERQQEQDEDAPARTRLETVFGTPLADDRSLRKAVERAYADPSVSPKRTVTTWKKREPDAPSAAQPGSMLPVLRALGALIAAIGEYGLWLLLAVLVLALLLTARRWLPWLRAGFAREGREASPVRREDTIEVPPLPDDVASEARRLWLAGRERDALALMYRASVESMAERAQLVLVPGATEAECLRASRRLPLAEDRDLFARAVRVWQYAAYARRLPDSEAFETLLATLAQRFGWAGVHAVSAVEQTA